MLRTSELGQSHMFCQSFPNITARLLSFTSLRIVLCGTQLVGLWSATNSGNPTCVYYCWVQALLPAQ